MHLQTRELMMKTYLYNPVVKDHINIFTKSFTMFFTNENLTERDISDKELEDFKIVLIIDQQILGVEAQKLLEV